MRYHYFDRVISMKTVQFTSWQDGEFFIGFLNEYPDYQTQGLNKEELVENLCNRWGQSELIF